jgi:HTH-type transcriptional regulator/antitoxin HigA
MKTLTPARPVPPGRLIRRELEERGWTQKELAAIMGRPEQVVTEIVKGAKQITPATGRELAAAFGTSAEVWLNLESNYRLALAALVDADRTNAIARRAWLHSIVPLQELLRRGWITAADDLADLELQLRTFLGIKSLDAMTLNGVNFRQMRGREVDQGALLAWLRRAEILARKQPVSVFRRERLQEGRQSILTFSRRSEEAARVPRALLELGVHCVLVPHLPRSYVDGATLWVDDNPVIVLSLRQDRIDSFWVTLMHELAHIVTGPRYVYLDEFEDGEGHVRPPEEREADAMARDWLLDPQAFAAFVRTAGPSFAAKAVKDFAKSQDRTPGIVLGRLYVDGLLGYDQHRFLIGKVRRYLEPWVDVSEPDDAPEHAT